MREKNESKREYCGKVVIISIHVVPQKYSTSTSLGVANVYYIGLEMSGNNFDATP